MENTEKSIQDGADSISLWELKYKIEDHGIKSANDKVHMALLCTILVLLAEEV